MARLLTLGDLHKHFDQARDKLAQDREQIMAIAPLAGDFSRDEYGFAYMRAERIGMDVITHTLKEISWLPMQLDPKSELLSENRAAMKRWLAAGQAGQPDCSMFGNDFIHALTRMGVTQGWDSEAFRNLALRVGELFHDLSCLIGLIYYGVWMSENGIDGLPVTDPADLERTAQEISRLTRSPEVAQLLKKRKQIDDDKKAASSGQKHVKPVLRVIENADWKDNGISPET